MSTRHVAPLLAGVALLLAVPASAADTTLSNVSRPTGVAAYAGRVAWSHYDSTRGAYVLASAFAGKAFTQPVAPRAVPFDMDLGPDAAGKTVAVYSRCATEPTGSQLPGGLPAWSHARGCHLYRFDFATQRELPIPGTRAPGASEYLPSIWKNRVAFARIFQKRPGAAGRLPHLFLRTLSGTPTTREVPGATPGDGPPVGPTALDLRADRLTFAWDWQKGRLRFSEVAIGTAGSQRLLRVDSVAGSAPAQPRLLSPSFSGTRLKYAQVAYDPKPGLDPSLFLRYELANRRRTRAPAPKYLVSTAADGPSIYYVRELTVRDARRSCLAEHPQPTDTCLVARASRLRYR